MPVTSDSELPAMGALIEHRFPCPWCWSRISMLLDLSVPGQEYIEDCERCCSPIRVRYEADEGELVSFSAERSG